MKKIWNFIWTTDNIRSPFAKGFWHIFRHSIWAMPMALMVGMAAKAIFQ